MRKRIFAVAFPVLVIVTLVYLSTRAETAQSHTRVQRDPGLLIANQPSDWVPFSADVEVSVPGDATRKPYKLVGRFYRDQNGSERLETGPENEPIPGLTTTAISIKNIPSERFYSYSVQVGWISQPMKLPAGGWKPKAMYTNAERPLHTDQIEGFDVYRATGPAGDTWLLAPALNGLALVEQVLRHGHRQVYSHIRLGPQSADLFEPPSGTELLVSAEFGGIITANAGEPHQGRGGTPADIRDEVSRRHELFLLKYPQAKNWRPQ